MASDGQRTRCRERLEMLSGSTLDRESLQREAIVELRRVIGFDQWCWPLADPETLLPGSGVADHDYGPALPRALEFEYSGADFAAKDTLARRTSPAGSLAAETGGDLARSPRWDEVMRPVGIGDLAAAACRDAFGCWGWIEIYRNTTDRRFADEDVELLANTGPDLGSALRRRVMARNPGSALDPVPPGVLVLDRDLKLISQTASAQRWVNTLPAAGLFASWGMLPAVVYPAATRARSGMAAGAHALLQAEDGTFVRIEAAVLEGNDDGQTAVTLRAATAAETFDLVCRAHTLSRRERQVVALLVTGLDTQSITEHLGITAHTVQDHLKSVFAKLGVHSRRELVATLSGSAGVVDHDSRV